MRLVAIVLLLAVLAGCTTWRSTGASDIHNETAFVVTDHNAYELEDADFDGDNVVGTPAHEWLVDACQYDDDDSPMEIAKHCGWRETPTSPNEITINAPLVRKVHVERSRHIGAIVGSVVGLALLIGLVVALVALTPDYTCSGC